MPSGANEPVRYTKSGTNCSSAASAGVAAEARAPVAATMAAAHFRLRRFVSSYLLLGVIDTGIGPVGSRVDEMAAVPLVPAWRPEINAGKARCAVSLCRC